MTTISFFFIAPVLSMELAATTIRPVSKYIHKMVFVQPHGDVFMYAYKDMNYKR